MKRARNKNHALRQLVQSILEKTQVSNGIPMVLIRDNIRPLEQMSYIPTFESYMTLSEFHYLLRSDVIENSDVTLPSNCNGFLKDVITNEDVNTLVDLAMTTLGSLPWDYTFWVELPKFNNVQASPSRIARNFGLDFSISEEISLSSDQCDHVDNRVFLKISAQGYASYGSSLTVSGVVSQLKHFLFICLIFSIGEIDYANIFLDSSQPRDMFITRTGHKKQFQRVELRGGIAKYLNRIRFKICDLYTNEGGGLLIRPVRAETPEEKANALSVKFFQVGQILDIFYDEEAHEDVKSIKASIEWFVDSEVEDNETISFIQACIGLEALLGSDKNKDSSRYNLPDRCAHLLGRSATERQKIKDQVQNIFNSRNTIVHGRNPTLGKHTHVLYELREDSVAVYSQRSRRCPGEIH